MKNKILYTLYIYITVTLFACSGFEISDNGDLDGMWHLVSADSIGVNCPTIDFKHEGIFWSVQDKLLSLEDKTQKNQNIFMRFSHEGTILKTFDPYINHHREQAEEKTEDVNLLRPFGINTLTEQFVVERLDGEEMILQSNLLRLKFIRY